MLWLYLDCTLARRKVGFWFLIDCCSRDEVMWRLAQLGSMHTHVVALGMIKAERAKGIGQAPEVSPTTT